MALNKIVSTPNLQLKTIFFNYEDVRRDLELCHSLGMLNEFEFDRLIYILKKAGTTQLHELVSRKDLGRRLLKWVTANSNYGFLCELDRKELVSIIWKIYGSAL